MGVRYLELEDWASLATIIASVSVVITIIFVWVQTSLQGRSVRNEAIWHKRDSIKFLHGTLIEPNFKSARDAISSCWEQKYDDMKTETKSSFRSVMSTYGMIARMIEHDVLEEELFKDYWESTFKKDWKKLRPFVLREQQSMDNLQLFGKAQAMAERWGINKDD